MEATCSPKHRLIFNGLQDVTTQQLELFITTVVRISTHTWEGQQLQILSRLVSEWLGVVQNGQKANEVCKIREHTCKICVGLLLEEAYTYLSTFTFSFHFLTCTQLLASEQSMTSGPALRLLGGLSSFNSWNTLCFHLMSFFDPFEADCRRKISKCVNKSRDK
jgi:hypothetical protein